MHLLRGQGPGAVAWVLESLDGNLEICDLPPSPLFGFRVPICTLGWAAGSMRVLRVSELKRVTWGLPGLGWEWATGYRPLYKNL